MSDQNKNLKEKEETQNLPKLGADLVADILYKSYPESYVSENERYDSTNRGTFQRDYHHLLKTKDKLLRSITTLQDYSVYTGLHHFDAKKTRQFQLYNNKVNSILANLEKAYIQSTENPAYSHGTEEILRRLLMFKSNISGLNWNNVVRLQVQIGDELVPIPDTFKFNPKNNFFDSEEELTDFLSPRTNPIYGGFQRDDSLENLKRKFLSLSKLSGDSDPEKTLETLLTSYSRHIAERMPNNPMAKELAKMDYKPVIDWIFDRAEKPLIPDFGHVEDTQLGLQMLLAGTNKQLYHRSFEGGELQEKSVNDPVHFLKAKEQAIRRFEKNMGVNLGSLEAIEAFTQSQHAFSLLRSPITLVNEKTGETSSEMGAAIDKLKEQHFRDRADLLQIMSDYGNRGWLYGAWDRKMQESVGGAERAAKGLPREVDILAYPPVEFMEKYPKYKGTNKNWIEHWSEYAGNHAHILASEYQSARKTPAELWADHKKIQNRLYRNYRPDDMSPPSKRNWIYNYRGDGPWASPNSHVQDALDYESKVQEFVEKSVREDPTGQIQTGVDTKTAFHSEWAEANRTSLGYEKEGLARDLFGMPTGTGKQRVQAKTPRTAIKETTLSMGTDVTSSAQTSVQKLHKKSADEVLKNLDNTGSNKTARQELRRRR